MTQPRICTLNVTTRQVCIYDLHTGHWSALSVDAATPLRRACHAAGVVGQKVLIIGGRYWDVAEDDYIFLNDIQILDTQPASTFAADWAVSKAPNQRGLEPRTNVRQHMRSSCLSALAGVSQQRVSLRHHHQRRRQDRACSPRCARGSMCVLPWHVRVRHERRSFANCRTR